MTGKQLLAKWRTRNGTLCILCRGQTWATRASKLRWWAPTLCWRPIQSAAQPPRCWSLLSCLHSVCAQSRTSSSQPAPPGSHAGADRCGASGAQGLHNQECHEGLFQARDPGGQRTAGSTPGTLHPAAAWALGWAAPVRAAAHLAGCRRTRRPRPPAQAAGARHLRAQSHCSLTGIGCAYFACSVQNEGSSGSSRWPARSTAASAQAHTSERAAPRSAGGCRQRSRRVGARPRQAQKGGFDIRRVVAQQVLSKANWRLEVAQALAAVAAATSCSSNCVRCLAESIGAKQSTPCVIRCCSHYISQSSRTVRHLELQQLAGKFDACITMSTAGCDGWAAGQERASTAVSRRQHLGHG